MTHFDILIDGSGSMGYIYDNAGNPYERYLLADGKTTRTELVKKILINSIIPKLSFVDSLSISAFKSKVILNDFGNPKLKGGEKQYYPDIEEVYIGNFNNEEINYSIEKMLIPHDSGTPLSWATCVTINQSKQENINIIILSDGDDSLDKAFDNTILKAINNKICKIYFIGISQNEGAQKKSKNLADKTNGFYLNLEILNYDEKLFESILFEWNATITSNALKDDFKIENPEIKVKSITGDTAINLELVNDKKNNQIERITLEEDDKEIEELIKEEKISEATNLKSQVEENTKSLKLIACQLDNIVKELNYLRKNNNSNGEDEFIANEDEEKNRAIGYECEKHLNSVLKKNNWEVVNWLNETNEQGKPYDFQVVIDGMNYCIECKGSTTSLKEFFLTKKEWLFYLENRKKYRLYFVSEINSNSTSITRIEDLLTAIEKGQLIPCSSVNRKVKADRILFQII